MQDKESKASCAREAGEFKGKYMCMYRLRASPAVWQIELPSLIFGKNVKNIPPTVWQKTWQFLATWKKTSLQRVNIRVQRVVGIVVSSQVGG